VHVEPLSGKARDAIGQKASIVALEGSVRSGKTWASLIDWVTYCLHGPEGQLLMTGRTERTVIENTILPLQAFLGERRVKLNRGLGTVHILGRRCRIVGANDEAAVTKIQGPTFAGCYVDEASTLPEAYFNMAYSRLSVEGAQLWLTSNPEGPAHWLMANWLSRARLWIDQDGNRHENPQGIDLVRVSFKLEDNPNLPPAYVERVKAAYTGLWYRRYIKGEWCVAEGAIFEDWEPALHVVTELPPIGRVLAVGIDHGTTHHTRGYLLGLSTEPVPRLVIMREWRPSTSMTDVAYSADFRRWLAALPPEWQRPEWIAVSPDAASFRLQLFADGHHNVMNATNNVLGGIRLLSSLLTARRLVVSDECTELVKRIPSYVWDPKATKRGEDAPLKVDDDEVDALRYAVASTRALWGTSVPITLPIEEAA
jgi:PBSX family phage terminase large subunit